MSRATTSFFKPVNMSASASYTYRGSQTSCLQREKTGVRRQCVGHRPRTCPRPKGGRWELVECASSSQLVIQQKSESALQQRCSTSFASLKEAIKSEASFSLLKAPQANASAEPVPFTAAAAAAALETETAGPTGREASHQTLVRVKVPVSKPAMGVDLLLEKSYPRVAVAAHQNLGQKKSQEDYHMSFNEADQGFYITAVFDGHGGAGTARHASQHLAHHIKRGLHNSKGAAGLGLKSAFRSFDRWWSDAACDPAVCGTVMDTSGATAVVSVLQGEVLTVANAGDSHGFLVDCYGSTRLLTTPHDLTNEEEVVRVIQAGGHIIAKPGRKPRLFNKRQPFYGDMGTLVTRSFGDSSHKAPHPIIISEPDVTEARLQVAVDTAMVLVSDGVTDVMSAEMLGELLKKSLEESSRMTTDKAVAAAAAADALVQAALGLGSGDNITASVTLFSWEA